MRAKYKIGGTRVVNGGLHIKALYEITHNAKFALIILIIK